MKPEAIIFDYGNTLVEFGPREIQSCDRALARAIGALYGEIDLDEFRSVREEMRGAMFRETPPTYRERDFKEATADLLRRLYGVSPTVEQTETILEARTRSFVNAVRAPDFLHELLRQLGNRYSLALLSNYPSGKDIRNSLEKIDVSGFFDVIVVSGEVGFAKPHPDPFQAALDGLGVPAQRALHVGDNWLTDIQGASRMGIPAIWTTQYEPYEAFERKTSDHQPVVIIEHLKDLRNHLD